MDLFSLKFDSSFDKDIPVETDIVTEDELQEENVKVSDLYYGRLFTVVPKEHDLILGLFPEDQGFHKRFVFAWSNIRSLLRFNSQDWTKVSFIVPEEARFSSLIPLVGGAYGLPHVSNSWKVEELADTDVQDPYTY